MIPLTEQEQIKMVSNKDQYVVKKTVDGDLDKFEFYGEPQLDFKYKAVEAYLSFTNPSEKMKEALINNSPSFIEFIDNPSERLQELSIEEWPSCLKYIKNPSKKIQEKAFLLDPLVIKHIVNVPEEWMLKAIEKDYTIIDKINHPTSLALQLAKELKKQALQEEWEDNWKNVDNTIKSLIEFKSKCFHSFPVGTTDTLSGEELGSLEDMLVEARSFLEYYMDDYK